MWQDAESGQPIEMMFRSIRWSEDEVARRLVHHEASDGYTTEVIDNIRDAIRLEVPSGWFERLQRRTIVPYPPELQRAILNKNWPILRTVFASQRSQIVAAMERDDANAVAHQTVALLASFWDVIFALNGAYHPGEKRLVAHAEQRCPIRPPDLEAQIRRVLATDAGSRLIAIDTLLDDLDACIVQELGALPPYA